MKQPTLEHTLREADCTSACNWNLTLRGGTGQEVLFLVDAQGIGDIPMEIHPVVHGKGLIIYYLLFQQIPQFLDSGLALWVQLLQKPLLGNEHHL